MTIFGHHPSYYDFRTTLIFESVPFSVILMETNSSEGTSVKTVPTSVNTVPTSVNTAYIQFSKCFVRKTQDYGQDA